jgi:hypothetical protein
MNEKKFYHEPHEKHELVISVDFQRKSDLSLFVMVSVYDKCQAFFFKTALFSCFSRNRWYWAIFASWFFASRP